MKLPTIEEMYRYPFSVLPPKHFNARARCGLWLMRLAARIFGSEIQLFRSMSGKLKEI